MQAYGATFDLTPRAEGMKGAIARAAALAAEHPGAWILQQFENPANPAVHARTTAQEILTDFPDGLDALITGVGTGGHITGCADILKQHWPKLLVFAVEPAQSAVISGGAPAPHPIQGIGAGFIPANLHTGLLDGTIQVEAEEAREFGAALGDTGGIAGRHLLRRHAGCNCEEACRPAVGRNGAGLQLRHGRALSIRARLPASLNGEPTCPNPPT